MAKFKKGDRVQFIEEDSYNGIEYNKGSKAVVEKHNHNLNLVTLTDDGVVFVSRLELITDYQPITPKLGERYRVLKQNKVYLQATPGRIITLLEDDKSDLPYRWSFSDDQSTRHMNRCDFVTTEYLELDEA